MGTNSYSMIIMLVAMVAIFYFLLIRPEKKRKKEEENLRSNLKVGDKHCHRDQRRPRPHGACEVVGHDQQHRQGKRAEGASGGAGRCEGTCRAAQKGKGREEEG